MEIYRKRVFLLWKNIIRLDMMDRLDIGPFRVVPLNKKCRELNRKYILPFGYTLNKLFTSNWSEKNYDGINFYDVFDRLLSMEEKTDEFKEEKDL